MEERLRTSVRGDDNYAASPTPTRRIKTNKELDDVVRNSKDKRNYRENITDPDELDVAEWQRAHGVKADGLWGRQTDNAYWQTQKMQRVPESEERQAMSRGLMEDVDTVGRTDLLHGQRDPDFNRYTDRAPESDEEPGSDEREPSFLEARNAETRKFKTFENGYDENFSKRRRRRELRAAGVDRGTARRQARFENIANHAQREADRNGYERTSNTNENLEYMTKDGRKVYYHGRANGGSIDLAKLKFL